MNLNINSKCGLEFTPDKILENRCLRITLFLISMVRLNRDRRVHTLIKCNQSLIRDIPLYTAFSLYLVTNNTCSITWGEGLNSNA
jgi:hypothetical protein